MPETPEAVALELLREIAYAEDKNIRGANITTKEAKVDREWILDAYAECLEIVRGHRTKTRGP
jgi:hypothetical protein